MNARRMIQVQDDIKRFKHKLDTMSPDDKEEGAVYRQYIYARVEWELLCYRLRSRV